MLELTTAAREMISRFELHHLRNLAIQMEFGPMGPMVYVTVSLVNTKTGEKIYTMPNGPLCIHGGDTITIDNIRVSPTLETCPPMSSDIYTQMVMDRIKEILDE